MTICDRKLNRLSGYDYSQPGWYFITICTWQKIHWFGHVQHNRMCVNQFGAMIYNYWHTIPNHFDSVSLDTFIIMPNHIHGIIRIHNSVRNGHGRSLHDKNNVPMQYKSDRITMTIPTIINGFKSSVTRVMRNQNHEYEFRWQKSYHDRIIRSERELQNVRKYILENPRDYNK